MLFSYRGVWFKTLNAPIGLTLETIQNRQYMISVNPSKESFLCKKKKELTYFRTTLFNCVQIVFCSSRKFWKCWIFFTATATIELPQNYKGGLRNLKCWGSNVLRKGVITAFRRYQISIDKMRIFLVTFEYISFI